MWKKNRRLCKTLLSERSISDNISAKPLCKILQVVDGEREE